MLPQSFSPFASAWWERMGGRGRCIHRPSNPTDTVTPRVLKRNAPINLSITIITLTTYCPRHLRTAPQSRLLHPRSPRLPEDRLGKASPRCSRIIFTPQPPTQLPPPTPAPPHNSLNRSRICIRFRKNLPCAHHCAENRVPG